MATTGIQSISSSVQQVLNVSKVRSEGGSFVKLGFGSLFEQSIQSKAQNLNSNQTKKTNGQDMAQNSTTTNQRVKNSGTDKVEQTSQDTSTATNSVGEILQEACDQLKEVILDKMGITEEQLDEALEALGLTMLDLFQPGNLTNLFLQQNGTNDMSMLLTDETLASNLQSLLEQVQTINPLEQLELTPEDAKEILSQLQNLEQPVEEPMMEKPLASEKSYKGSKEISHEESKAISYEDYDEPVEQLSNSETTSKSAKTSGTEQGFLSDHEQQTKHETTKEVNFLVNGSGQITQETKVSFMEQLAPTSGAKEIVEQIVQEIRVTVSTSQTSMEMVLTPETLGRVSLTVTAKAGVMTAHMVTETEAAKEAIESQMATLKETLDQQGLKVDAVEVTVAANNFDFMNQSQMHEGNGQQQEEVKKSGNKLKMMQDETEEEIQTSEAERVNASIGKGTQIDLSA